MAITTRAHHFTNAGVTAAEFREVTEHMYGRRGGGVLRTGSTPENSLLVDENGTPNMSVDVADGSAVVQGTEAAAQGVYLVENQASVNLSISASDPTNPRKDLIVVRIKDQEYASGSPSTNTATIEVLTGTPAGSPADPTVPDNCVVLARVDVPATDTAITDSQITDLRWNGYSVNNDQDNGSAVLHGGESVGLSTARPQAPYDGMRFYQTDTDSTAQWDGSAWRDTVVTTFTPSNTNITTSSNLGWYTRRDGMVVARYQLVLSAAPSGNVQIGLPVTVSTASFKPSSHWGQFHGRIGTTNYEGFIQIESSGTQFTVFKVDSAGVADQRWDATNPGAWASGHTLNGTFTYFI